MRKVLFPALFTAIICTLIFSSSCSPSLTDSTTEAVVCSTEKTAIESSISTPTPIPTYAPGTELYGMLSISDEVVIEPQYEYLDLFSEEGLARFCAHGLWGYVNTKGEEVISAQYEDANNFSEGLAAVKVDGLWGFIDESGKMVSELQTDEIYAVMDGGFFFVRKYPNENLIWFMIFSTATHRNLRS